MECGPYKGWPKLPGGAKTLLAIKGSCHQLFGTAAEAVGGETSDAVKKVSLKHCEILWI